MKKVAVVKSFIAIALVLAFSLVLPAARADERDQATKLTFNHSVQIPGRVLPAGTYWFVLADSASNRDIVRIFNSDRSMLYATLQTIAADRPEMTGNTAITFAEQGMQPETIVSWFYPGSGYAHQFQYSKPVEQELARAKQQTVTVG
jgi:hypothetical protein